MRVGLVIYGSLDTLSGGYLYDRKLVAHLRRKGDDVRIVSLPWRGYTAHLTDNLRFRLPSGLDILIQDELNHPSLLGANARRHAYPVISLVHHLRSVEPRPNWQNRLYRLVERAYLKSVDGFIFNSKTTCAAVNALTGISKPFVIAIPGGDNLGSGLDVGRIRSRSAESPPLRLLFVGNLIPRKGLHVLLKALRRLPAEGYALDVVGSFDSDPHYARKMRQWTTDNGLDGRVRFHGALDEKSLIGMLEKAQLLVLPSLYEGFGIAYLEGMAYGLPAVATTSGAAAEIITDGKDGYLVPPDDPDSLAACLRVLANDRASLEKMSLNARRRFQSAATWEESMAGIRKFMLDMLH